MSQIYSTLYKSECRQLKNARGGLCNSPSSTHEHQHFINALSKTTLWVFFPSHPDQLHFHLNSHYVGNYLLDNSYLEWPWNDSCQTPCLTSRWLKPCGSPDSRRAARVWKSIAWLPRQQVASSNPVQRMGKKFRSIHILIWTYLSHTSWNNTWTKMQLSFEIQASSNFVMIFSQPKNVSKIHILGKVT